MSRFETGATLTHASAKAALAAGLARIAAGATGAIAQNVSLYCASEGLATVVRGWIDHRALADALKLNEDELPILAQTVGRPGVA